MLSPDMLLSHASITYDNIKSYFRENRWVTVELRDYKAEPGSCRRVESVRHTVKCAQILLLIGQGLDLSSQIAWELLKEAPNLVNEDGGWKEFRHGDQKSSLYTSEYVYQFLSQLFQLGKKAYFLRETETFFHQSIQWLVKLEDYMVAMWHQSKWLYGVIPWKISALNTFIEYAPYSTKPDIIEDIYRELRELVNPSGRWNDPNLGSKYGIPEYTLSVRLAYCLGCIEQLRTKQDSRRYALEKWVISNYTNSQYMNTPDIAFLADMLKNYEIEHKFAN